jgi:hypothetical protein
MALTTEGEMEVENPGRRRFTLIDAMLLIAATTPGLVLLRVASGMGLFTDSPKISWGTQFIEYLTVAVGCLLVPMSFAVLAISVCDRRTSPGEVVRGIGFITCLTIAVSAIFAFAFFIVRVATTSELDRAAEMSIQFNNFFGRMKYVAGPMILGVWMALALTGRRQPPTWMDRLGFLIGIGVVLLFVYPELYHLAQPLLSR